MENAFEHCDRCGTVVYPFSKGAAASDDSNYCVKCSEEIDRTYLSRNVCSVCTALLGKNEIKFVMPSRMYSNYFFDRMPIENRLMCLNCYRRADKLDILRKPLVKIGYIRARLSRALVRRQIARNMSMKRAK